MSTGAQTVKRWSRETITNAVYAGCQWPDGPIPREFVSAEDYTALERRVRELEEAIQGFRAKWAVVEPHIKGMFALQWARTQMQYDGPSLSGELAEFARLCPDFTAPPDSGGL